MSTGEAADLVLVGHVRTAHGIRGEVLIEVLSDFPDRFEPGVELIVNGPNFGRRVLTIESARPHRGGLLLLFEELGDRDAAEALRSADLMVPADSLGAAPEGSYYYFDLIGRACRDRRSGDLGEVIAVHEDGGGLLLEIRNDARTVLVPFVRAYLVAIDDLDGPIEFDLPDGLLDVCASR